MRPAFVLLFVAAALVVAVNAQGVKAHWAAPAGLCRWSRLHGSHGVPASYVCSPLSQPGRLAPSKAGAPRLNLQLPSSPRTVLEHTSKTLKHTKTTTPQVAASSHHPPALPPPAAGAARPPTGSGAQAATAGPSASTSRPTTLVTAPKTAAPSAPRTPPSSNLCY